MVVGESGGVGCSTGLIDRDVPGLSRSCLSGIATCRGDSCRFLVLGEGCESFQSGPPSHSNSSCFSNKGVIRMGAGHGGQLGATGMVFSSGESSLRFPVTGGD